VRDSGWLAPGIRVADARRCVRHDRRDRRAVVKVVVLVLAERRRDIARTCADAPVLAAANAHVA
jgi:hypothetical protein